MGTRRSHFAIIAVDLLGVCALHVQAQETSSATVELRTDNRMNPLGQDRLPPALSWRMEAAQIA
jgi:hypothetical protein